MKVNIPNYKTFIGPYQIADTLRFIGVSPERRFEIGTWIHDTFPRFNDFCNQIYEWRSERKDKIKIYSYDTYSLDATLAKVIHPALVEFRKKTNGYPANVGSEKRWKIILDEMIWAFGEYNSDWEEQFHHGKVDVMEFEREDGMFEMVPTDKYTHWFDKEGYKKHQKRIQRGINLFSKYYQNLWW